MTQHRTSRRAAYGRRGHELGTRPRGTTPWSEIKRAKGVPVATDELVITLAVRTCIGCGCNDDQACPGGCWWTFLDPADGGPLCSRCAPDAG